MYVGTQPELEHEPPPPPPLLSQPHNNRRNRPRSRPQFTFINGVYFQVYMDWGLARNLGNSPRAHCGLRDRLLFRRWVRMCVDRDGSQPPSSHSISDPNLTPPPPSSRVYYSIIVFNFALRFCPPMIGLRYTGPTGIEGVR